MEIVCECGYVARGADEDELVGVTQGHARDVHRVDLTAELVVALARATGVGDHADDSGASST